MNYFFYICLFLFWTIFWSFASVLLHRLKNWEWGIITWRSHCPKCNTTLKALDLVPILSFLSTGWKCRYCKYKISGIYPLLEITTGLVFTTIWANIVDIPGVMNLNTFSIVQMLFLLWIWYITVLYIFYDILFMEIHEGIMGAGIALACIGIITQNFWVPIIPYFPDIVGWASIYIGVILLAIHLIGWYAIMIKELSEWIDIAILLFLTGLTVGVIHFFWNSIILSAITGALGIFLFFYFQIFVSRGKALGWWDLRIGIMIGLLLWGFQSIIGIIISYLVGWFLGIFILIRDRKKQGPSEVPFWPFLGIWFLLTFLYSPQIVSLLEQHFLFL